MVPVFMTVAARLARPVKVMPPPLAETIRPLLVRAIRLPARTPSRPPEISASRLLFNVATSPLTFSPLPLAPPVIVLSLVNRPTDAAFTPCRPPEIAPRLIKVPIAPRLSMPSLRLDLIVPPAAFSSSVIAAAATAAPVPPSMRPVPVLVRLPMVLRP